VVLLRSLLRSNLVKLTGFYSAALTCEQRHYPSTSANFLRRTRLALLHISTVSFLRSQIRRQAAILEEASSRGSRSGPTATSGPEPEKAKGHESREQDPARAGGSGGCRVRQGQGTEEEEELAVAGGRAAEIRYVVSFRMGEIAAATHASLTLSYSSHSDCRATTRLGSERVQTCGQLCRLELLRMSSASLNIGNIPFARDARRPSRHFSHDPSGIISLCSARPCSPRRGMLKEDPSYEDRDSGGENSCLHTQARSTSGLD
jgi:hypothetical protein